MPSSLIKSSQLLLFGVNTKWYKSKPDFYLRGSALFKAILFFRLRYTYRSVGNSLMKAVGKSVISFG